MRPPLNVLIVADGDDALRLYKRVGCAARALGLELHIAEEKSGAGKPRVLINDELLVEGLPRTETIQEQLARWLAAQPAM
jgi:hypothetical protein